jgi:SseB protein N-terminal domain
MDATELEALVVAVATGSRQRSDLVEALLTAKVAVLLNRGLEWGALSSEAKPLTLNSPEGFPILATFSSVEKAGPWVKNEPAYGHALYTTFSWALGIMPADFGIGLNPGYKWSFLIPPVEVQSLKDHRLQPDNSIEANPLRGSI